MESKKQGIDENFNVSMPTKENIEYAFKNLLFYLTGSSCLDIYRSNHKKFNQVFTKAKHILKNYVDNNSLIYINEKELEDIKFDLIDLDQETKVLQSYYAEWSLLWLEAIMSLRKSEIMKTGK